MMSILPKRKPLRLPDYDYSSIGSYFVTICTKDRENIFWKSIQLTSIENIPLSSDGLTVRTELEHLSEVYPHVRLDTYCIMPDHIHMIISIDSDEHGRPQVSTSLPRVIKQFKGSVSKKIGRGIWQRSYMDRVIRNERGYNETWEYIANNPAKYL